MQQIEIAEKSQNTQSPHKKMKNIDSNTRINKYKTSNIPLDTRDLDFHPSKDTEINDIEKYDDDDLDIKQNNLYVGFNRLLHSRRCIYTYIFLILSSITVFCYSLIAYFFHFGNL